MAVARRRYCEDDSRSKLHPCSKGLSVPHSRSQGVLGCIPENVPLQRRVETGIVGSSSVGTTTARTFGAPKCRTRHLGKVTSISPSLALGSLGSASPQPGWVLSCCSKSEWRCLPSDYRQPEKGLVLAWAVLSRWSGGGKHRGTATPARGRWKADRRLGGGLSVWNATLRNA